MNPVSPPPSPDFVLREAARDDVITDDEVYAWGRAFPDNTRDFTELPQGLQATDCYRLELGNERQCDMDTIADRLRRSGKRGVDLALAENDDFYATDYYLSKDEFDGFYKTCRDVEKQYGLGKIPVALANTVSSSACWATPFVMLNIRQAFHSKACYDIIVAHEMAHLLHFPKQTGQHTAINDSLAIDTQNKMQHAYERLFHTQENRSDHNAMTTIPNSARGFYDLFVGEKPDDREDFQKTLDRMRQANPADTHDTDLDRVKTAMLVSGRALR